MKNIAVTIFILLIVLILVLYFVSFQVRETESVVVTTFGEPRQEDITEPGWYWKWPPPIEVVHRFDSRLQLYEGIMEETTTKGGEPIIVTSYVLWRIAEPRRFLESVSTIKGAEDHLRSRLREKQNSIIGQHYFSEFVNTNPAQIKFADIEKDIFETLKEPMRREYGIEVKAVGIKQLGVSEKVTEEVFARMRADRTRIADATISEGKAEATKIRSDAESKRKELLAAVDALAKSIKGAGDAEAAKYYKMLEDEPDFAKFLRDLEALKKILKERSTIVLSGQTEPFKLLREMPDIEPKR
jgi:membrane protease subunit HflC